MPDDAPDLPTHLAPGLPPEAFEVHLPKMTDEVDPEYYFGLGQSF